MGNESARGTVARKANHDNESCAARPFVSERGGKKMDKHNHGGENNNGRGDWIHVVIGHMEHLMDLFEVALAFIVAFGFILSVIPLLKQIPHLASYTTGTEEFHEFLENTLTLVIGIEFIKMLIKHTPGSVIEVLLFAIARHAILTGGTALENLLTILAIAVIFAIRKFIFIESFEFAGDGSGIDWLNDWKEIVK